MTHQIRPSQIQLGAAVRVTLTDGQVYGMRVSQIGAPGTYGTSHAAGARVIAHIRPGGYSVDLASSQVADAEIIPHTDYPHHPGHLYDCAACELACHCASGESECVFEGRHSGVAS